MSDVIATNQTILVAGGGISGVTAAIEAAECGKQVILVEKNPSLGGRVSQLYKYFPKLCFPSCCMATLKQTTYLREKLDDDFKASVYYIDIRATDRIDDFYQKVQDDENVTFIRSKVASITEDTDANPVLNGVDTEGYQRYANSHDLCVLAVGMQPSVPKDAFPIDVVTNESGFIEADEKNGGIFAAGCSSDALDVNRAVQSATARKSRTSCSCNVPASVLHCQDTCPTAPVTAARPRSSRRCTSRTRTRRSTPTLSTATCVPRGRR
jgi:heterodisulfide reductase subunit A-like polyferredoxin